MDTIGESPDPRIGALNKSYEAGMRSKSLSPDVSPWVRAGLEALEQGLVVTSDMLAEADRTQTMRSPERNP